MTLPDLRKRARLYFKKDDIDIIELMVCWCDAASHDEKQRVLFACGITAAQFKQALQLYRQKEARLAQRLLTEAVHAKSTGSFLAADMISFALRQSEWQLAHFLRRSGMDVGAVITNIEDMKDSSPDIMRRVNPQEWFTHPAVNNMAECALNGEYDGLSGREDDIERVLNVLLRRDKAHVILTGAAGVGKTALVELMARKGAKAEHDDLKTFQFVELCLDSVLEGTMFRGELERRLKGVIQKAAAQNDVGAIAEILKPYLGKSSLRVIGATTTAEYRHCIAKNSALARRFTEIAISEPTGEELFNMLRNYADQLQRHHRIVIPDDMITYAGQMTGRYLTNRTQPDKTCGVLDSAAVITKKERLNALQKNNINAVISAMTRIPGSVIAKEMLAGDEISARLKQRIFGQDEAIDTVSETLMVKMFGMRQSQSPIAVFMFAGDSGVGKTALAKSIADVVLGDPKRITVIDMAEFSERHSVSKLIGSPPGYVGSEKEGILPLALSENAYRVILFDEIEKAAPEVIRLLLGIMDTGSVTSGIGASYDATNTILVMTTNALSSKSAGKRAIGFDSRVDTQQAVTDALQGVFPAEFLGRIDDIIMFNPLSEHAIEQIIEVKLEQALNMLSAVDVRVRYDMKRTVAFVISRMKSKQLGAREIESIVKTHLLRPLMQKAAEGANTVDLDTLLFEQEKQNDSTNRISRS
jgi:ATP-dependent Clp protease ATP-binding subunit ClpA